MSSDHAVVKRVRASDFWYAFRLLKMRHSGG
jgi:hypothetical protein